MGATTVVHACIAVSSYILLIACLTLALRFARLCIFRLDRTIVIGIVRVINALALLLVAILRGTQTHLDIMRYILRCGAEFRKYSAS